MRVPRKSETENKYTELGFKPPAFVENTYGIRIYIGTKGKDDWTVVVPKWIIKNVYGNNRYSKEHMYNKDVTLYCITEECALDVAERHTRLAQNIKEMKKSW